MNIVLCTNEHFYDADMFEVCPHCGTSGIAAAAEVMASITESPQDPFIQAPPSCDPPADDRTISLEVDITGQQQANTYSLWEAQEEEPADLAAAIKKASANPEGKTAGYFKTVAQQSAEAADTDAQDSDAAEPTVGWLVCIKGAHFGESFSIVEGQNSIGRCSTNEIVISKDGSVSREKHAGVIYEPRKKEFYIKPGDGKALTYLNGEMIAEMRMLKRMDRIEIGSTILLFIPLCGEDFCWENYMKGEY